MSSTGDGPALASLRRSLAAHHPDARVDLLVAAPRHATVADAFVVDPATPVGGPVPWGPLRFADVALGWGDRAGRFAALSVWLSTSTLAEPVVVLPEWAWVTGPLDAGIASLDRAEGALVGVVPGMVDDATGAAAGPLVPEVLVVRPGAAPVGRLWAAALVEQCLDRDEELDPWLQVVAAGGPVALVGDRGWALAPRTVGELAVAGGEGAWTVEGKRLAVASFPDFDPAEPWWYAEAGRAPQLSTSEAPGLRSLCRSYAADLQRSGRAPSHTWATDALVGVPAWPHLRAAFRAEIRHRGRQGLDAPPNPFVPGEAAPFLDWWTGPGDPQGTTAGRAADAIWSVRPDLALAFPAVRGAHQDPFRRWLWSHAAADGVAGVIELPDPPQPVPTVAVRSEALPFGVNLVGYHGSELGLGVAVRRMGLALDAAHIPWQAVTYDRTSSRQRPEEAREGSHPGVDHHFTLVMVTPEQLPLFVADGGGRWLEGHHSVGLWYWEADVMPSAHLGSFHLVDEVWGATEYLRSVFARHTDKPVCHIPVPFQFDEPDVAPGDRERLGLDERFTFLFTFDFLSVVRRKNPLGLVEAYRRAFPEPGPQRLVLKSINGDLFARDRERLLDATADRDDIDLWDRYVAAGDRLALVALADCYVSLHRSEGLGLTMAEAMAMGTPVIASRYSGNLDFMDDASAILVGGEEVLIGPGNYYPAEGHWFDPDLDEAAAAMQQLRADPELASKLAHSARGRIAELSPERVGEAVARRLRQAWRDRR